MGILSAIVPKSIGTAQLASSSVPETDHLPWNGGTTYASGAFCISLVTHRIYQSQKDGNINRDPTNIINQSEPTVWWTDYGPTNRWAMFDGDVSTQTIVASPLTFVLTPGTFNTVYWAGLDADDLTVTIKDAPGGNVVFSETVSLEGSAPGDYDEYFWDPFKPLTDLLIKDVEQYAVAEISVAISATGRPVKCGFMALGDLRFIGKTLWGVEVKPRSFSYVKTDEFGRTKIKRRKATTDLSLTAVVHPDKADGVVDIMQEVLDVVVVWIGSDLEKHRSMRVVGLGNGVMKYPNPGECHLQLSVMGVISTTS